MSEDVPPVFDRDLLEDVARAASVSTGELAEGAIQVQSVVAGFADLSVDDIVYEWRTQHHKDPLFSQTPDAYYLNVREHVWDDVFDRASVDDSYRFAIRELHTAQFEIEHGDGEPTGAMVLHRP